MTYGGRAGSSRVTFDQVTLRATKSLPCPGCGRKVRRQHTFMNTDNPYNVGPDGVRRTREQIRAHLAELAAEWVARPERHEECSP